MYNILIKPHVFYLSELLKVGRNVIKKDSTVKIVAPIYDPDKVLCIGMNYKDHCEEQNAPVPKEPVIFNKFPSCIIGPTDDLVYPTETNVNVHDSLLYILFFSLSSANRFFEFVREYHKEKCESFTKF